MRRNRYDDEHEAFRASVRTFMERHVTPFHAQWERAGQVDRAVVERAVWVSAGKQGFLGFEVPEALGGSGIKDFRYNTILTEETLAVGATGLGFMLHNDVVLPYLLRLGTPEQQECWLPPFCTGELITAIAMTEPGTGSDLLGIRTTARRDGNDFILNGTKTFITKRDLGRPGHRGGAHRSRCQAQQRNDPAGGRAGNARLRAGPALGEGRATRAGHGGAGLHRRPRARVEPAWHTRPGVLPSDGQSAAGTLVHRGGRGRCRA